MGNLFGGQEVSEQEKRKIKDKYASEIRHLKESILDKSYQGTLRILVFGPSGMGKSAFCNGVVAAVEDRVNVPNIFPVGSIGQSYTDSFHWWKLGNKLLIDMAGVYETNKITKDNIRDVVSGKISFYEKITKDLVPKTNDIPPERDNDVSCVVILYNMSAGISEELKRQLRCIMEIAGEGVISYHIVLTQVDVVDNKFKDPWRLEDLSKSEAIQNAISKKSRELGVPKAYISVVKNYIDEPSTDVCSNLLFLRAMERVVTTAVDQAKKRVGMSRPN